MVAAPEEPSFGREDLVLTMDKLYKNETLGRPSWATGTKLMEMQDPKRGQPKPERKPKPKPKPVKADAPANTESAAPASKDAEVTKQAAPDGAVKAPEESGDTSPQELSALDVVKSKPPPLPEDAPTEQAPKPDIAPEVPESEDKS